MLLFAAIGFLAPGVLLWHMDRRGYERARKIVGTLSLMVCGIVPLYVTGLMPMRAALWGLGIIGFSASGVIVWYLHKRKSRKKPLE